MDVASFLIRVCFLTLGITSAAHAANRVYVASYGSDINDCRVIIAPCRSFTAALALTTGNWDIVPLDSAGYGTVTITTPVTISAPPGLYVGVTASAGAAITIDTTGRVVLRGLTLNGLGGVSAIAIVNSDDVTIDSLDIAGFSGDAVVVESGAMGTITIRDSVIQRSGGAGVLVANFARVIVDRVDVASAGLASGAAGISTTNVAPVTIHDSVVVNGIGHGAAATAPASGSMLIDRTLLFGNSADGAYASGGGTALTVAGSAVQGDNQSGIVAELGSVATVSDNRVFGNRTGPGFVNNGATFSSFVNNALDRNNGSGPQTSGTITPQALQ